MKRGVCRLDFVGFRVTILDRMLKKVVQQGRSEVHGAKNNERHVCGRRRVGEPAVSCAWSPKREAYLKQYVEGPSVEPARLAV